eukprot:scaffold279102_cov23-Tisochrysis_lutea.AAC.1
MDTEDSSLALFKEEEISIGTKSIASGRLEPGHGMSRHSDGCACVTFSACQDASMHMLLLGLALSAANASALEFHWPGTVLQSTLSDE